ncbi:HEAT-PBS family protein [Natronomonas pharaonis DSM 2160]|uniref:HEAT-PBS family protein n=1 Tax=Natronomonas pharaonis (strain ATCC 35678 / DSM 2160 / CIP 103997 / JCM 8858 / NBRC 14720 / NCIMB 2260 / Gabara) TaxID=348780 RepID=A0A1U7EX60_NATPD|nr:HEAT repeat domain-containing protein [Natronomonas pharaonis]CAI49705.1 HEAT-PBS family protein [Natronomonas pharaonis DSM 2160]
MSNGDDESTEDAPDEAASDGEDPDISIEEFETRLDDIEAALEDASTEDDLDAVEADADDVEADLETVEFPVPEPDDEDEEPDDPKEPLVDRLSDIRDGIEDQRGPYGDDVASDANGAAGQIRSTRWTRDGRPAVKAAVETFLDAAGEQLDTDFEAGDDIDAFADAVETVAETAADGRLDADDDAETIAALLDAVDDLESDLDDAEEWSDLEVAEQLRREGFYDRLTAENRRDFPPELNVVRIAEAENDPERILMAFEQLDSDFMQENCIDALSRLGPEAAFEEMNQLAQRREVGAIEVLGKIGDERAVETLSDFVDSGNPPLQKATIRALGEIGSQEATQPLANALADEEPMVRSMAARGLGLIGDTRAIAPLEDVLGDDDEPPEVRASAAWALVQIGTERALEAAAAYDDDRVYTVQLEAEKAREATA